MLTSRGKLRSRIYRIEKPARVVIDSPETSFRLPRQLSGSKSGLVRGFRYGIIRTGEARIVIDVAPGTLIRETTNRHLVGEQHQLTIALQPAVPTDTSRAQPCAGSSKILDRHPLQARHRPRKIAKLPAAKPPSTVPEPANTKKQRPIIVIDPGHGGLDPGAVVNRKYLEKTIVLAVARRLSRRLRKTGHFRVVMTRNSDKFISLDNRIERTRAEKADLFLSLHADSVDDAAYAAATSGAAVYILSHRASDSAARRLAEKENKVDLLAGILPRADPATGVRSILVDLLKRETERESARLRTLLIASMRSKVPVSRKPMRSAAFHVLKQTETPAALIELGYMTNPADLKRMGQAEWQQRMVGAVTDAVKRYFDRN